MTLVLALDIATTTGFAYGGPEQPSPKIGSVQFGSAAASPDAVFGAALAWANRFFAENKPDLIAIEKMLPPMAMSGKTTRSVRDRLAGLQGILRGAARNAGLFEVAMVDVGDIREHFIGQRGAKRDSAKLQTMQRCRQLRWTVDNDNEADAAALWSYQVSRIDPRLALRVSPLFARGTAI